ncbi:uncharacterized protein LOC113858229 [Abrus precatorius]|uniref:Uncharacterized protein LOC113858229 n=1 Tax=Abrus precatorius TaxID=3816 RepID=A0A8B8KTA2_ABRPR|nr:uncharacterized protein LOC113858229 [Abrus precatorius]
MEKIFRALQCTENDNIVFAAYTLTEDAEYLWDGVRQRLEREGIIITWPLFQVRFLEKYFSEDVREKKEMKFLALTQGSMNVGEYAVKFEELSRYHPHYHNAINEKPRCVKFVNGLRLEIKEAIKMQEI